MTQDKNLQPYFKFSDGTKVEAPERKLFKPGSYFALEYDISNEIVRNTFDLIEGVAEENITSTLAKGRAIAIVEQYLANYCDMVVAISQQTEVNRKINKHPFILPAEHVMPLIGRASSRAEGLYKELTEWTHGFYNTDVLMPYGQTVRLENGDLDLTNCIPYINSTLFVFYGEDGWHADAPAARKRETSDE